jgi:hypothetical protein
MPFPLFSRFKLPSRVALLLGMGALSAAGARADVGRQAPGNSIDPPSKAEHGQPDTLRMWSAGARLYLSEHDRPGHELQLQDTPEARRLRQLLQEHAGATTGVPLDRMILAGGGGMGISWERARNPAPRVQPQGTTKARSPLRELEFRSVGTPREARRSSNTNSGTDSGR